MSGDAARIPEERHGPERAASSEPAAQDSASVEAADNRQPPVADCGSHSTIAAQYSALFDVDRADEGSGGYVELGPLLCWYASHVGPQHAQKPENQDAAYVLVRDQKLFFALADGVSTSFGSRFAAAAIVKTYCEHLAAASRSITIDDRTILDAVSATCGDLSGLLSVLIDEPNSPEWDKVKGASPLAMEVVLRLAQNTFDRQRKFWGPVMAATMISGIAERRQDCWVVRMIRIGDGFSEHIDAAGGIAAIFSMDAEEMAVEAAVGPGATLGRVLEGAEVKQVSLRAGETLVISSDGLTRGSRPPFAQALDQISDGGLSGARRGSGSAARDILDRAAKFADDQFSINPDLKLFADNLSMLILRAEP